MELIKNYTPYKGKLRIKIEFSNPHYRTGKSILNKFYFKLFGLNVSSRMFPKKDEHGTKLVDPKKKLLIESFTGGYLSSIYNSIEGLKGFTTHKGDYVGDEITGWWYYNNNLKVDEEYPGRVAEVWNESWTEHIGYYGYSHRGGQLFKIGDKIFEEHYEPIEEHFEPWQWEGWKLEMENSKYAENIIDVIPFKLRGSKTIENLAEAKEAARHMANYLA